MKIEIDPGLETPTTLRALATMLVTLADGEVRVTGPVTLDLKFDEAQIDAMVAKVAAEVRQTHQDEKDFDTLYPATKSVATEAMATPPTAASYFTPEELAAPVREAPLPPPAPPIAAAALFSTAPVVPPVGVMTTVPPPPAPTAPVSADNHALDVNGVAWDANLHASTRAKNVDGTWRARRNLGDKAVTPPPPPIPQPIQPTPVPVTPPPPPVPGLNPFPRMMRTITDNLTAGRITKPQVNEVLAAHGVLDPGQIAILSTLPDTATNVIAALVALGAQNV